MTSFFRNCELFELSIISADRINESQPINAHTNSIQVRVERNQLGPCAAVRCRRILIITSIERIIVLERSK